MANWTWWRPITRCVPPPESSPLTSALLLPDSRPTMSVTEGLRSTVERALAEDAPAGDLTGTLTLPETAKCRAELRAKAAGVLAGTDAAGLAFDMTAEQDGLGPVEVDWRRSDGDEVAAGDVVAIISGPARSVLRAERVVIN